MSLHDSWSEIDKLDIIELDNEFWPLSIIINIITHQLNNSNMENPYLIYPNNPFTRIPFTITALLLIRDKVKQSNMFINITLKLLLEQPEKSIIKFYTEAQKYLDRHSILLMALLCKELRFMTINYKNSQSNYIGFWVRKNYKLTNFEKLYINLLEAPYQIICRGSIINNPYREYIKVTLRNLPIDEAKPTDLLYCEQLN
ncbi:MAG: hypothetical protein Barrevirus23_5 [Barrevirus sp.]|uniref:Uncharacterized protein n=1 Tax=Barrevirus sp. TaxID=2487763 RepID=A0A3G4ZQR7_9VIRU|nr:MAG: hypothetical protein Barrevirus23_5 [Barrevirus sp.]